MTSSMFAVWIKCCKRTEESSACEGFCKRPVNGKTHVGLKILNGIFIYNRLKRNDI